MNQLIHRILFVAIFVCISGCDSGSSDGQEPGLDPGFDRGEMLENLGNSVILPAYMAFQETVNTLHDATDTFVATPSDATLGALQDALKNTRLAWQEVALFQFGPAENLSLRGSLNTFPVDLDQVDANINSGTYVLGTIQNLDAGGFPALDYLVHGTGSTLSEIVDAFTTDANAPARVQYLQDNVDFIQSNVDAVVEEWLPEGGNYLAVFLSEERGGVDVGSSLGQLINALVLHYERFIRDGKIGIPAGVRSSGIPRPLATESRFGGYSRELAQSSMQALGRLYEGTGMNGVDGVGIKENLESLDAATLANDISLALRDVENVLNGLSDPLSAQIETDTDAVLVAFTEMQNLVVLLKADMTSFLGITITFQDNDGD